VPIAANDHLKITPTGSADRTAFVRGLEAPNSRGTESSNPFSSSGQSANFRSLSRWRDAPAPRLFAGVNIIAFHRRDAGDVQRAIDHRSSRTPAQLVGSLFEASDPLGREITHVSNRSLSRPRGRADAVGCVVVC